MACPAQGRRLALIQWLLAAEMRKFGYTPVKLSAVDWLLAPSQAALEVGRWVSFRIAHAWRRTVIGADASRLYALARQAAGLRLRQRGRR